MIIPTTTTTGTTPINPAEGPIGSSCSRSRRDPDPGGSYRDFILAGLLALNLTTSTMGRRSAWPPTCTRG